MTAMRAEPYLVGGRNRIDTEVMRAAPDIVAKEGAEALNCAVALGDGLGIAVKVADGGYRAAGPALIAVLDQLGLLGRGRPPPAREARQPAGARRRAPGGTARAGRPAPRAPLGLRSRAFPRRLVASMRKAGWAPRGEGMRKGSDRMSDAPRVAVLSVHTSPVDQPGIGDSGGMNVYIREVAGRLAAQGVARGRLRAMPRRHRSRGERGRDRSRVIPIKAGPCTPLPKADLPRYLPEFLGGVLHEARFHGIPYDVVHSHYWLSGWVGRAVKEVWDAPLVASFHTLGKVKNYSLARDERPESAVRLEGEERVIGAADRILAATPLEAGQLVGLYRADPEHVRLIPPGVDHVLFSPRDRMAARERLHLTHLRFALYVGRLQPHKGPDVAIRTVAEAVARDPETTRDLVLGIVGGPSGSDGEVDRLIALADDARRRRARRLLPAADPARSCRTSTRRPTWCSCPSRSESFGLVALEAAACGTPVVAASVGGLRYVVEDGRTGFLVEGHDPGDHADRMLRVLRDGALQASIGSGGVAPRAPVHLGRHGERSAPRLRRGRSRGVSRARRYRSSAVLLSLFIARP